MKRQPESYTKAIERIRDNETGCNGRPSKCTAKKTCICMGVTSYTNGFFCIGIYTRKKDMDVVRTCSESPMSRGSSLMTPSEARMRVGLFNQLLAIWDDAINPDFEEFAYNMQDWYLERDQYRLKDKGK
jgi:hypothetical protein